MRQETVSGVLYRTTASVPRLVREPLDDGHLMRVLRTHAPKRDIQTVPIFYPRPSVFLSEVSVTRPALLAPGGSPRPVARRRSRTMPSTALHGEPAHATVFHRLLVLRTRRRDGVAAA